MELTHHPDHQERRESQLEMLREMIFRSFPQISYHGTIVAGGDRGSWSAGHTEDADLIRTLKGTCWAQIPADFLARNQGNFVLLTAKAFAAFIPAWLVFALENDFSGAEFIVYTFSPLDLQASGPTRPLSVEMFRALNPPQRRALHLFLQAVMEHDGKSHVRDYAAAAADTVDELISVFESGTI